MNISESEFARICEGLKEDRKSIIQHNPIGSDEEILLWMLLSSLVIYLSLTEIETPCFSGTPILFDVPMAVLRQNPVHPAQPGPGGRVLGILPQAADVEIAEQGRGRLAVLIRARCKSIEERAQRSRSAAADALGLLAQATERIARPAGVAGEVRTRLIVVVVDGRQDRRGRR